MLGMGQWWKENLPAFILHFTVKPSWCTFLITDLILPCILGTTLLIQEIAIGTMSAMI
jgi:hypothetical protein